MADIQTSERLQRFQKAFRAGTDNPSPRLALASLTGSSAAFAAVSLALDPSPCPFVLAVTPGLPEADLLAGDVRILEQECAVHVQEFPLALEGDRAAAAARLKAAAVLGAYGSHPVPLVVVAPSGALLEPVPRPAAVAAATVRLMPGETPVGGFSRLLERLLAAGYERAPEVVSPGQLAVRGGVLDVWPPDAARPVRAEFFGDELDSLRTFDPALQTSIGPLDAADVPPVCLDECDGQTLLDVVPEGGTILWLEHNAYSTIARAATRPFARQIFTGDPAPPGVPSAPFLTAPLPGFAELGMEAVRNPELLDVARTRLARHLAAATRKGERIVEDAGLSGGFETDGLVVVTTSDRVFAHRHRAAASSVRERTQGERLTESFDIEPGEYVVHLEHGIGRFVGSTEVEVAGRRSEVFTIEYADGARLHVPVSHAHLLSRYVGVKGQAVKLHRLDGRRWTKEKAAAQRSVRDLASSLLELQARRAVVPGFVYDVDAPGVAAFEAAFPYEATPDQAAAVADVKRDMAATKPMDRLLCGDAGYGKTEVAMRAAFIAAINGRQTVLLAPTTVLAEQHYETFLARFAGTPIRIEAMSRFQSDEAKKATRARLLSGVTDIVIGTHALLSVKVQFHDLGLIIIDEEQRFGVKHKEYLKRLRATADVLTMSATPIPRTLYLSMTGARDLSLLRTPPRERVATVTKIVRDADTTVKAAIETELARGGQIFFLHNRVLTIGKVYTRLRELVPDARIEVAHGQMATTELAAKMQRFAQGDVDVLLCTTIVESGLDIPRANTILVDHAERFGLAELYQLRGRVGRSARQGHAYFLLPEDGDVDSEACERLDALKKHAGVGAGFNIALRDLEIRGAGNLLGREQSGHIAAVGFQLYCQLLQRTVARLKGEAVPDIVDVALNFDFLNYSPGTGDMDATGACLPYDYVEDDAQRMDFHRRLAETTTLPAVKKLRRELADRYGRLPKAAERLVRLAEFRVTCARFGLAAVTTVKNKAFFYRRGSQTVAFVGHLDGASTPEKKLARLMKTILAHATS